MSRIFDALQRSMTEGDGLEFPFNPSSISEMAPATEVEAQRYRPERSRSLPIADNLHTAEQSSGKPDGSGKSGS